MAVHAKWQDPQYVTAVVAACFGPITATADEQSMSTPLSACRKLVHSLLCGTLPRVPTLQELIYMRQEFEACEQQSQKSSMAGTSDVDQLTAETPVSTDSATDRQSSDVAVPAQETLISSAGTDTPAA